MPKAHTTYSFTDVSAVLSHPSYGQFAMEGEGIGDFTINKMTERTAHDVAADGHIMVSKIAGNNGTITINAQQTSALHNWLQGCFNYCWAADTDEWARITLTIRAPKMGKMTIATGGSFNKEADEQFQAQGQRVSWTLMFADVQKMNFA